MKEHITGKKVFNTVAEAKNVADYVVARLVDLGITHSFSVPGDFAFTIDRALIHNSKLTNILSANELNASYAADGYARVKGAAILSTTFAVGELSALNGVMGAKSENLIIFHLVGFPNEKAVANRKIVHHTLGDGDFSLFYPLSAAAACVSAVITPDNAKREMNRVIYEAFKYRKPAYITISLDNGQKLLTDQETKDIDFKPLKSDELSLSNATNRILELVEKAKTVVAIPSIRLDRFGVTNQALRLIEALDIPFVIMPNDKTVFSEHHKNYAGYYAGATSDPGTADIVEKADLVLNLGDALWSDFNTGGFTNHLNLSKVITLAPAYVQEEKHYFSNVHLPELLEALFGQVKKKGYKPHYNRPALKKPKSDHTKLQLADFYHQFSHFLQKDDLLIVETGSSSLNMPKFPLPDGVKYHNQTLWGSIGWATPATLGAALACPNKRTILVTGEGSHQLTLNELGVMGRYGISPIIFCINNQGFMIERGLEKDPNPSYDDLAQLNYVKLPEAFGCKNWLSLKVTTGKELADALASARKHPHGVYVELVTGKLDYGDILGFYNKHIKDLYS
ncbi:MAG: hypothetical protein K2X08_07255 [Chlamydiales bacterium]|nr:hypothetical protein [Chlamydiales bacterium]